MLCQWTFEHSSRHEVLQGLVSGSHGIDASHHGLLYSRSDQMGVGQSMDSQRLASQSISHLGIIH